MSDENKVEEVKKEGSESKPQKAAEAIFDEGSDEFVEVDRPEESKTTPDKEDKPTEFASSLLTPDKEDSAGSEPLRKSLEGLSPQ